MLEVQRRVRARWASLRRARGGGDGRGQRARQSRARGRLDRALPDVGLGRRAHERAQRGGAAARGAAGHRRATRCSRVRGRWTKPRASATRRRNLAAALALAWFTAAGDGRGKKDMVVLPYKDRLELFSRYLQQLVMESLGKASTARATRAPGDRRVRQQGLDRSARVRAAAPRRADNFFVTFIEVLRDRSGDAPFEVDPGSPAGDYLSGFSRARARRCGRRGASR
jgi:hypothetical protein